MAGPEARMPSTSAAGKSESQEEMSDFSPRAYQLELFEHAKKQNSILVLGTGSGKTFISILLIKELADQIRGPFDKGKGKRTVFVVNTVPLVYQQAEAIKRHTPLSVGTYEGSIGVDYWTNEDWESELEKNEVLVVVAQIFKDLVLHARLPLSSVNLLIIDECHHATGSHPMREVMREYERLKQQFPQQCPRVLGLTACVIHKKCKVEKVMPSMLTLEASMNSALVTSTDFVEVKKHSTAPKEVIVAYVPGVQSKYQEVINAQLIGLIKEVESLPDIDEKSKKAVRKRMNNICYIMEELGDWCVARAIQYEMDDFENSEELEDIPAIREMLNFVRNRLKQIHDNCLTGQSSMVNPVYFISEKVKRLIEIFLACNGDVCGLIFVQRRNTAKILYDLLLAAKEVNSELAFINALYVVGCNQTHIDINLAKLELRKQKETLAKFHKGECNFIISTSVLEEGVDVRKCNIVIRFDKPQNFRAYVQSKGRARALPSRYVLMTHVSDVNNFKEDIAVYKKIEASLSQLCHDRLPPSLMDTRDHFAEDEYILPYQPYGSDGPKVTMNSAIQLLNVYCGHLPHDKFTELTVEICFHHRDDDQVKAGIKLPINAPLKDWVYGEWMENKDLAKKSAAINLCRVLHQAGELNDHLRPTDQKEDILIDGLVDIPEDDPERAGTKKRRQVYSRDVAPAFTPHNQDHFYLYSLNIKQQGGGTSDIKIDSGLSSVCVGMLCRKEIIDCPFPLYFAKWGEVEVKPQFVRKLPNLIGSVLKKIEHFHKLVYEEMLQLNSSVFEFNSFHTGVLIVPLASSGDFDSNLLERLEGLTSLRPTRPRATHEFYFERSRYEGSITYPVYNPAEIYYITHILEDLNPTDKFPEGKTAYDTYEEYFFLKYNTKITNKSQPLLEGKRMVKDFNYLKKPLLSKKKDKTSSREPPRFIPELCNVMPIRASFWWQLTCVPSILHRLNSLGIAHQLNCIINNEYYKEYLVETTPMDFAWADKCSGNPENSYNNNLSVSLWNRRSKSIHPSMLVHALTLRQANDNFDLERLEILGDSFLKYVISEYVCLKYSNDHEGRLSDRRTKLVCNKTLYSLAKMKHIPEKIMSTTLVAQRNGLLPGFDVKHSVVTQLRSLKVPSEIWPDLPNFGSESNLASVAEEKVQVNKEGKMLGGSCYNPWTEHEVPDKSVADVVEAIIGAYLLGCGAPAAVEFLHNLGVGIHKGESLLKTELVVPSARVSQEGWAENEIRSLYYKSCLDKLEKKIGYIFRDKSFIVQAVTHSSYRQTVTDCYQRLEFLGDAVLDYLVTGLVYSRHPQFSPGKVSDIRSHYVKNETLALVCVKGQFHQHMLHMAPKLEATIDKYLNSVESDSGIDEDLNIEEDEVEWQDVDVPKALGDLVESIIGAVFLDSDRSLQRAWEVIQMMMGNILSQPLSDIPINCVRQLYEVLPEVQFKKVLREEGDDYARYQVYVDDQCLAVGKGKNFRTAKMAVAKLVLKKLRDPQA